MRVKEIDLIDQLTVNQYESVQINLWRICHQVNIVSQFCKPTRKFWIAHLLHKRCITDAVISNHFTVGTRNRHDFPDRSLFAIKESEVASECVPAQMLD